jgi:thioredoxin 1
MEIKEILKQNNKVLIDFYADWCGPCKKMSPIIDQLKLEQSNNIEILKLNIDQYSDLAAEFEVMSIPTLLYFKEGNLEDRIVGLASKNDILEIIK